MTLEELFDDGASYGEIAQRLAMTKSNVAKIVTQIRMKRGDVMGDIDPAWARRRYVDDAADILVIADEAKCGTMMMRLYLQAHSIHRDRGHIYRVGSKPKHNKGIRVSGSVRDRAAHAAPFMSEEHRKSLASAKRGKRGNETNNWKGGHEIGGYAGAGSGVNKTYQHREIAEKILGRALLRVEHVHHIDKNRKNNEVENILLLHTSIHTKLHTAMRKVSMGRAEQIAWLIENEHPFEDLKNHA